MAGVTRLDNDVLPATVPASTEREAEAPTESPSTLAAPTEPMGRQGLVPSTAVPSTEPAPAPQPGTLRSAKPEQPTSTRRSATPPHVGAHDDTQAPDPGPPTDAPGPVLPMGQLFGDRYRLLEVIGRGGMGTVVEALHEGTKAKVAIKVMSDSIDKELLGRFQREARASGSVDSPHIVKIFDTGVDAATRTPFMVMERLHGEDLARLLERLGVLRPDVALRIVAQALKGLIKAHEAGIVHRDIKPSNLFIADIGLGEVQVKLLDFGIAKLTVDALTDLDTGLTSTGSVLGSPEYMSPEQAQGVSDIDHRTDIWSMGVVLYKLLSGQAPHKENSFGRLIVAICTKPTRSLREVAPWVTEDIAAITARATQIAPSKRFASAREMLDAVLAVQGKASHLTMASLLPVAPEVRASAPSIPGAPKSPSLADLDDAEAASPVRVDPVTEATEGAPKPRRWPLVAGAVLALAATAGVATWAFGSGPSQRTGIVTGVTSGAAMVTVPSAGHGPPKVALLRATVRIDAPGALVTVDGEPAVIADGALQLSGVADSKHYVKITPKSGPAVVREVVLRGDGDTVPRALSGNELLDANAAKDASVVRSALQGPSVAAPARTAVPTATAKGPTAKPAASGTGLQVKPALE
jgi:eukaryotic-like serine/threonine-protein kinase